MRVDLNRCIGCWACAAACKVENGTPPEVWWQTVEVVGGDTVDRSTTEIAKTYRPRNCMQCVDAPCIPVCPVDAITKRPDGIVEIDGDTCVGCSKCATACPYDAITMHQRPDDPANAVPVASKCNFCAPRVDAGQQPACVDACPTNAIEFGDFGDFGDEGVEPHHEDDPRRPVRIGEELGADPSIWFLPHTRLQDQLRSIAAPPDA